MCSLLNVLLFHLTAVASLSHPHQSIAAGIDIGTSGCRISLLSSTKGPIYSKSVLFRDIDSSPNAYATPSIWIEGLQRLISDLPERPTALSISSTSNSLLHVDSRTYAPISVSMYDTSFFQTLSSAPDKLDEVRLGIKAFLSSQADFYAEDPKVDLQTPFAPTGGVSKVLAMLKLHPPSPHSLIVPQSSFILNYLLRGSTLDPIPTADWNNLMKLGYDAVEESYIDAVQKCLGADAKRLPAGAPTGTFIGTIPSGSLANCDVYLGSTDSICAFIGALATAPQQATSAKDLEGLAVTSLGTTLATKIISSRRVFDGKRGVYSHLVPANVLFDGDISGPTNVWLAGGASQAGCKVRTCYLRSYEPRSRIADPPIPLADLT